jgi:hypothetical protein
LFLPQAGYEQLVFSCIWLKIRQQVRWLQLVSLTVQQSFQLPAEIFHEGISLEGSPSSVLGP